MAVITCTGCGEALKRGAESCPRCGAVVFTHPCAKCGQPCPEQTDECPWCDHPVGAEDKGSKPLLAEAKRGTIRETRATGKSGRSSRRRSARRSGCLGLLVTLSWL